MDPLSATSSIIAILQLSSKVVGYLAVVKDASKERIQCAIEISNLQTLLLNLKFHIEMENVNTPWYTAVRALTIENGPLDQFKQSLETLQSGMTDRGRLKTATDILMWKFKKDKVTSILGRIERLKTLVEIALQRDQMKLSQAIKSDTETIKNEAVIIKSNSQKITEVTTNIKDDTEVIRFGIDSVRIQGENVKHREVLEWLSASNYSAQQSDIMKRRQDGTGEWFLVAPQVNKWLSEPHTTLFCPGIPGAGKTIIASIAVNHLLKSVQSNSIAVACVYCNYKAKNDQDTSHMLAAILKQLVQAQTQLFRSVASLHNQHQQKGTKPSVDELFNTLKDALKYYSTIYIVVDALDEFQDNYGTRYQFLTRLKDLQAHLDIRLMFTSRPILEIEELFRDDIKLEVQASKEDVERYISGQLYRLPRCIQNDGSLQVTIQETIVEAVGGMFLLARLFVDSLLDKRTISKVKSTLKAMSGAFQTPDRAYDQAYNEAIDRIKGQLSEDTALAMSVLAWIINAKRPLTIVELCHAVAIEPKQEKLDPQNISDINDLVSVCAGLVSVDEESEIVRLVHYTTQEYLDRTQDLWNPGARLSIASTCLTYLSFSTFRNILDTCDTHLIESSGYLFDDHSSEYPFDDHSSEYPFDKHPFIKYAAMYWEQHLLPFQAELREQACLFLRDEALTRHAREVQSLVRYKRWGMNKKMNCLHIMAYWGMHVLLQDFMPGEEFTPNISIDSRDSFFKTPLSYAAASGHENVVKILLDSGADATCDSLVHALSSAAKIGHESIVTLLLDRGVDIGDWGHTMSIALEEASYKGHERVVRILLRRGANIYMDHRDALSAAIEEGHENIVKLLVDPCIGLNTTEAAHCRTALHLASERGHNNIVRFLLENGADVHCDSGQGTALHLAAYNGHESVVKTLLDWGADINAHYISGKDTALHFAIRGGHESVVKMLLDLGADVNAHCGFSGATIMCAAQRRNENITETLLDAGANVNILEGPHGSLLNTLAYRGSTRVLRTTIERYHADPKLVDFHGRTALLMAACAMDSDAFHYLLDLGLNPDAKDAKGDGILSYAALGDSEEVFKSVLEYSKGLERSGFWSPLHWACRSGNTYAVERLLEQGYRDELVTLPDSEETWDALSIAIYHDQVGMLEELSPSSASLLNVESDQRAHRRSGESTGMKCRSCLQSIYFPYYHCRECPKIDYCFMCKPLLENLHPHHTWDLLPDSESSSSGTKF